MEEKIKLKAIELIKHYCGVINTNSISDYINSGVNEKSKFHKAKEEALFLVNEINSVLPVNYQYSLYFNELYSFIKQMDYETFTGNKPEKINENKIEPKYKSGRMVAFRELRKK